MVLFTNTEPKFERIVLSLVIALIPLIVTCTNSAFSQQDQEATSTIGIKITSPVVNQQVPVGELTISGISTDNATTDCTVYADWNDQKPFQKAVATGLEGENDYSTWNFTYTQNYHLIANGTNNLTSKISCLSNPTNVTKWNSVNVIGEVGLTTPENDTNSREGGTSFEGQNLTTIGNQTNDNNNSAPTISPENDTAKTAPTPNNNNTTGNPIIDFFRGMFGT
ncbi:MAG: hypothetical protein ICV56_09525 [Nitrososphaeraceae archaeon]|nr:hypothetical protein [Nitrososphaeraceae archaeon]